MTCNINPCTASIPVLQLVKTIEYLHNIACKTEETNLSLDAFASFDSSFPVLDPPSFDPGGKVLVFLKCKNYTRTWLKNLNGT